MDLEDYDGRTGGDFMEIFRVLDYDLDEHGRVSMRCIQREYDLYKNHRDRTINKDLPPLTDEDLMEAAMLITEFSRRELTKEIKSQRKTIPVLRLQNGFLFRAHLPFLTY